MKAIIFFVVIFLGTLISCTKGDSLPANVPECVKSAIETAKQDQYGVSSVTEFLFQGKLVFALTPSLLIADAATIVYDGNCNTLCAVGGYGLPAANKCNGEVFYDKAVKQKVIWTR